jgi:hypothetical protein
VPVRVQSMLAVLVGVGVRVNATGQGEPAPRKPESDEQTATGEFSRLLQPSGNLPAEKQDERRAYRQQQRVAHGEPQRQPEGAAVAGGLERRGQRKRRDGHQVIGAETVEKTESEH